MAKTIAVTRKAIDTRRTIFYPVEKGFESLILYRAQIWPGIQKKKPELFKLIFLIGKQYHAPKLTAPRDFHLPEW